MSEEARQIIEKGAFTLRQLKIRQLFARLCHCFQRRPLILWIAKVLCRQAPGGSANKKKYYIENRKIG